VFEDVITIIERACENAFRAVNRELITMYWEIGNYISEKILNDVWGKSIVKDFSQFVQSHYEGIKGFCHRIYGERSSFTRLMSETKNSHHW